MHRGPTGRYEVTVTGGERVNAFVPLPLPPSPGLALGGPLRSALEAAAISLGRLDGMSMLLSDRALFMYVYIRKEAVLSSQIEGTRSSLSDLLLYEVDEVPGVPVHDVMEASNYVEAMEHGRLRLVGDFPFSNRLIREIHGVLLARGRGSHMDPGEFRRSQNWIGGTRPGNSAFVPPPHTAVQDCMGDLERFLHARNDGLPTLIRIGLAHAQFETIHPFLDGNGRVGRLLITLLLIHAGVLQEPLLYLSLYLKQHRSTYYELLDRVRETGDWEAWLEFFLEGVQVTAAGAVNTTRRLLELFANDRNAIEKLGRRAGSALRVYAALRERPILSITEASERANLSFSATSSAMDLLVDQRIVGEVTGRRRGRLFAYRRYVAILNEGTELDES
ncbi:MAG: Fic family protein [Gemmatimonadetes bacterium]|nr:Fic family protein [Gemmatimonadota bacterium]